MYQFFGNILNLFNSWTGNYMLALLLFALMVKILILPLSIMQQKNQIKGAKLKPKMMLIEKKYAGRNDQVTLKKKQQEIMELQQKEGYSAFTGCLPLLIQFPVIIILYRVIQKPLTYVSHFTGEMLEALAAKLQEAFEITVNYKTSEISFISEIKNHLGDLQETYAATGGEGLLADALPKMTFFGADMTLKPYFWSILLLIPVLNFALGVLTMKLTKKLNGNMAEMTAQTSDQKISSGIMEWMMPIVSLWFSFILPSALGTYWIFQSLLGIAQMLIMSKVMPMPKYTKEEMEQILKELKKNQPERPAYAGSSYSGDRPRSLHHIDDDDDFPDEKPVQQNQPKKRGRPAPSGQTKKLRVEDLEEKKVEEESESEDLAETDVEETGIEETEVEETAKESKTDATNVDLSDLVNRIGGDGSDGEEPTAEKEPKQE